MRSDDRADAAPAPGARYQRGQRGGQSARSQPSLTQMQVYDHLFACATDQLRRHRAARQRGAGVPASPVLSEERREEEVAAAEAGRGGAWSGGSVGSRGGRRAGRGGAVPLCAERIGVPQKAGKVELLAALPAPLAEIVGDDGKVFRDADEVDWAAVRRLEQAAERGAARAGGDYAAVIGRMAASDMIAFVERDAPGVTVNGLFCVAKDENQDRLIVDARAANLLFCDPPQPHLPTPADLAEVRTAGGDGPCTSWSLDLSAFFYSFRVPRSWWRKLGLPLVWSDVVGAAGPRRLVRPILTVLAMGSSWAVALAQAAHVKLLDEKCPLLGRPRRVGAAGEVLRVDVGRPVHMVYLDDLTVEGRAGDPVLVAAQAQAIAAYEEAGYDVNHKKTRPPSTGKEGTAIGLALGVDGVLRPAAAKFSELLADTRRVVTSRRASKDEVRSLVGRWAWWLLLRRPAFAVLSEVYSFSSGGGEELRYVPRGVRRELLCVMGLSPLLRADRRRVSAPLIVASDASSRGGGVSYQQGRHGLVGSRATGFYSSGGLGSGTTPVAEAALVACLQRPWLTAVSFRWRRPGSHINVLEGEAALLAVRWLARCATWRGTRVPLLIDSGACLGALRKGRSGAARLNRVLRRICAYVLAADLLVEHSWIATKDNPADLPSRL